jgi:hypothetical protein
MNFVLRGLLLRTKQNRCSILKAGEENCSNESKEKVRRTDNQTVNTIMLQFCWNVSPVNGRMLPTKVTIIAQWPLVENFFSREKDGSNSPGHGIYIRILSGELTGVHMEAVEVWKFKLYLHH